MKFEKNQKNIIATIIFAMVFIVFAAWYIWSGLDERERLTQIYAEAEELYKEGEYQTVIEKLTPLGDYKDSLSYIEKSKNALRDAEEKARIEVEEQQRLEQLKQMQATYDRAVSVLEKNQYELAITLFESLGDYSDSEQKAEEARKLLAEKQEIEDNYDKAEKLYLKGEYHDALKLFEKLKGYENSDQFAELCRLAIRRLTLSNTISAGIRSAAGIGEDGSVYFAGNDYNINGIESWENIASIATCGEYILGLTYDGYVLSSARLSTDYRIDTSSWSDILQIAVGEQYVVGLKADGTLTAQGHNGDHQTEIDTWADITQIATGWRHTVGLNKNGSLNITGIDMAWQSRYFDSALSGYEGDSSKDIVAISAGGGQSGKHIHTVALLRDGTVVAFCDPGYEDDGITRKEACDVSDWENIIAVAAGDTFIVGLTQDNKVIMVGETDETVDFSTIDTWEDVVAISAGTQLIYGLKEDGEILTVGYILQGQRNTAHWGPIAKREEWALIFEQQELKT